MGWKIVWMIFLFPIDLSIIIVPRVLLIVPYFIQFWLPSIPAPLPPLRYSTPGSPKKQIHVLSSQFYDPAVGYVRLYVSQQEIGLWKLVKHA